MKSLYSILGLSPDATPDQIEVAYAELLTSLQGGADANLEEDRRIRLVAIKEAYSVLSDPVARQRYNNKLFATGTAGPADTHQSHAGETSGIFGSRGLLIIGVIVLSGIALYSYNAQQREKIRIQHEREIQLKVLQLEEERQKRIADEQDVRLARQSQLDTEARERTQRLEQERYMRDFEIRQRAQVREEEARQRQENYEKQRRAREEEMRRNREMAEAQNRVMRDKMELQQIERERYGRVITR